MIPCTLTLRLPTGEDVSVDTEVSPHATAWADLERLIQAPIYPKASRC